MKEVRDPAIKLFGKEITLLENGKTSSVSVEDSGGDEDGRPRDDRSSVMSACLEDEKVSRTGGEESEEKPLEADDKDSQGGNPTESKQSKPLPVVEEPQNLEPLVESENNPKTPSIDEENASPKPPKSENDQSDTNNNQQKPLKKPDKILPCPRCNSMDTKFCYYNNYNVNQPRHFCKSCQRYWTAGGTTRNVPVGAGRRKNKNSVASHCRHITIPEALQAAVRIDAPSGGIHHPPFKTNSTVLSFGPEAPPLRKSMASILNLAEKKAPNGGENHDDYSTGSAVTTSNLMTEGVSNNGIQEPTTRNLNGFSSQIPCLPGVPWPYPWNSAVPIPAFCPFYPSPYWNCSLPAAWSFPWLPMPPPTTNQKAPSSPPNSPTLGKHSREGDLLKPSNPEAKESAEQQNSEGSSILIPKTLRIDDPDEAAKSSIWATLGIKNDSISRGSLFKAFQPKDAKKNHTLENPPPALLRANPAAFSRSLGFQETA